MCLSCASLSIGPLLRLRPGPDPGRRLARRGRADGRAAGAGRIGRGGPVRSDPCPLRPDGAWPGGRRGPAPGGRVRAVPPPGVRGPGPAAAGPLGRAPPGHRRRLVPAVRGRVPPAHTRRGRPGRRLFHDDAAAPVAAHLPGPAPARTPPGRPAAAARVWVPGGGGVAGPAGGAARHPVGRSRGRRGRAAGSCGGRGRRGQRGGWRWCRRWRTRKGGRGCCWGVRRGQGAACGGAGWWGLVVGGGGMEARDVACCACCERPSLFFFS